MDAVALTLLFGTPNVGWWGITAGSKSGAITDSGKVRSFARPHGPRSVVLLSCRPY
jgi:hypothetical protein